MAPNDLEEWVRRRPFEPFRMGLTDGRSFVIYHPELCMVGKRSAILGLVADPAKTRYDRTVMVDLLHILTLEPIEKPVPPNGPT